MLSALRGHPIATAAGQQVQDVPPKWAPLGDTGYRRGPRVKQARAQGSATKSPRNALAAAVSSR